MNQQAAGWRAQLAALQEATPALSMQDEASYLELWCKHASRLNEPLAMALAGGFVADGFAWVFMAGYQAAIRRTFFAPFFAPAEFPDGWLAFAASEDRSAKKLPGVVWVQEGEDLVLSGYKTWVAASRSVEQLVVKAGQGEQARYCVVAVKSPGLNITHKPSPGMLPDLSQGVAQFEQVRVAPGGVVDAAGAGGFGRMEVLYIYTAFLAYLYRISRLDVDKTEDGRDIGTLVANFEQRIAAGLDLATQLHADAAYGPSAEKSPAKATTTLPPTVTAKSAELATLVQDLRSDLSSAVFSEDSVWQRDQRLIAMYARN